MASKWCGMDPLAGISDDSESEEEEKRGSDHEENLKNDTTIKQNGGNDIFVF